MSNYIDQIKVDSTTYNILPVREISEASTTLDNLKEIPTSKKMVRVSLTASPVGDNDGIGLQAGLKTGEELFAVITPTLNGSLTASGPKVHNITGDSIKFSRETPFIIHFTCLSDKSGAESYLAEHFLINPTKLGDITLKEADLGDYLLTDGSCMRFQTLNSDVSLRESVKKYIIGICVTQIVPPSTPQYKYFIAMPGLAINADIVNYTKFTGYFSSADEQDVWDGEVPEAIDDTDTAIAWMNGQADTEKWRKYDSNWESMIKIQSMPKINNKSWWIPSLGELVEVFGKYDLINDNFPYSKLKAIRNSLALFGQGLFGFTIENSDNLSLISGSMGNATTIMSSTRASSTHDSGTGQSTTRIYHRYLLFSTTGGAGCSLNRVAANPINQPKIDDNLNNKSTSYPILMPVISFSKSEI